MTYTKESLAALLNGRTIGNEITSTESYDANGSGLVVVHGYSDDNIEFKGAIDEEIGCYGGDTFKVSATGIVPIPDRDEEEVLKKFSVLDKIINRGVEIEARWCKDDNFSWTYRTDIPHATFEIIERDGSGEKFCRGIVFAIADLAAMEAAKGGAK